ncbi:MAG: hypothetical protein Q7R83_04735, partial [bacterium]|nr:hypothetical protein [bacterium]
IQKKLEIPNVFFFVNMLSVIERLKNKHEAVKKIKSTGDIHQYVETVTGRRLPKKMIEQVEWMPFEVRVAFKSGTIRLGLQHEWGGLHYSQTPLSLYRAVSGEYAQYAEYEETKWHESMHNVLDGSFAFASELSGDDAEQLYYAMRECVRTAKPADARVKLERALKRQSPVAVVDGLHNELMATSSLMEGWDSDERLPAHVCDLFWKSSEDEEPDTSTAGRDLGTVETYARKTQALFPEGSEESLMIGVYADAVRRRFTRATDYIRHLPGVVASLGWGAQARVHTLLFLLKPSEYRHIPQILERWYPEQGLAKRLRDRVWIGQISLFDVPGLTQLLERYQPLALDKPEQDLLASCLSSFYDLWRENELVVQDVLEKQAIACTRLEYVRALEYLGSLVATDEVRSELREIAGVYKDALMDMLPSAKALKKLSVEDQQNLIDYEARFLLDGEDGEVVRALKRVAESPNCAKLGQKRVKEAIRALADRKERDKQENSEEELLAA